MSLTQKIIIVKLNFSLYNGHMPEDFPQKITEKTQVRFNISKPGLYAISTTARCSRKDDLRLEIDNQFFREIPPEKNAQKYNVPPAWNGTKLKGRSQINIFLVYLGAGEHTVTFIPRGSAQVESWDFQQVMDSTKIELNLEQQAENGNGRPWITIALIDLSLKSVTSEASVSWHLFDGDDVQLIIDNKVEKNSNFVFWRNWLWHATPKQIFSGSKREQKIIIKNLDKSTHYLEFWADRTPILHSVILNLGEISSALDVDQQHSDLVPTVDDPEWTGNFEDDAVAMILARLIFGEARNQSQEAMTGAAWVIKNRVDADKKYFGSSYHEVILKNDGKYWQFSSFIPSDPNFKILINPLSNKVEETDKKAWFISYDIASKIVNNSVIDPTEGATFFHSSDLSQEKFTTQSVPGAIFIKRIGDFLFYKDPNEN